MVARDGTQVTPTFVPSGDTNLIGRSDRTLRD
jgi:hypothetical protein